METLFEKNSTALVIIDLQKGIVAMPTEPYDSKTIISNTKKIADIFRENKMPVFLVRVAISPDGKDKLTPIVDGENPWGKMQMPADWSEITPELGPNEGDIIITKKQWGAFYGTELDLQLRRRKIDTIVLCGISTNIGVESTARFAFEYGYQQIFVEDAMSSRSRAEHEHTVQTTFPRMGRVRLAKDILSSLEKN